MYSDLVCSLNGLKNGNMTVNIQIEELKRHIKEFKLRLKATSDGNCESWLHSVKFHLLANVVDDLERFGCSAI